MLLILIPLTKNTFQENRGGHFHRGIQHSDFKCMKKAREEDDDKEKNDGEKTVHIKKQNKMRCP